MDVSIAPHLFTQLLSVWIPYLNQVFLSWSYTCISGHIGPRHYSISSWQSWHSIMFSEQMHWSVLDVAGEGTGWRTLWWLRTLCPRWLQWCPASCTGAACVPCVSRCRTHPNSINVKAHVIGAAKESWLQYKVITTLSISCIIKYSLFCL